MPRRPPWIYTPSPEEIAEKAAADKLAKVAERWGVFAWEQANMYRTESALRVYKRRHAAEAYADKINAEAGANLVVRKLRS